MLEALMQNDFPLSLAHVRRRMETLGRDAQVVSLTPDGATRRASFAEVGERVQRLGRALERLGVEPGDRVATFCWNNQPHFELYMAVPCFGAVLHTLNIRLFAEQLTYIVNHARDRVIFVDASLLPVLAPLVPRFETVEHFVVIGGERAPDPLPAALSYAQLLADAGAGPYDWPEVDERQAAALCYTSGTTGNPKGVLYGHRSLCLHSSAMLMADCLALSARDRVLAVVPMFHANAWGLPFAAAMAGCDLLLPDCHLQAEPLARLIEAERPTLMGCVPTVFADLLRYADEHQPDLSSLVNCVCGGSAVPRALAEAFEQRHGVRIWQAWGMTETSPLATVARPPAGVEGEQAWGYRVKQGRVVPWVEIRVVDDAGNELPWDGEATGEIEVRGPWIAARYYEDASGDVKFHDGWLRTGDIGSIDELGYMQISDRAKDVIKSGGEWISSVELESQLMAHPAVLEAAVIAKPDERWAERPLACVVVAPDAQVTPQELVEHLRGRVAKWWLPDEFAFIDEVPKTSVGKFDKKVLRGRLADGTLAGRVAVGAGSEAVDGSASGGSASGGAAERARSEATGDGAATPARSIPR